MLEESEVFDSALALSEDRRAELAKRLIQSLDSGEKEPGYEEAWAAELDDRSRRFKSGEIKAIPVEEAIARLRQRLADSRTT